MGHIYFDHNATTSVAPAVLRELPALFADVYGNASSIHRVGQAAKGSLENSRRTLAAELGCDPAEIVWTSGGTEADNLAIFGVIDGRTAAHAITSAIEHPAVLNAMGELQARGVEVTYIPVGASGRVDAEQVRAAIRPDTRLISIMHANNETGVLQPIAEIARSAKEHGVVFHVDGVQTGGRIPVSLHDLGIDLYAVSGHKMGALKGCGALYVRKGIHLKPLFFGGHHERDRRAGTENVPGAATVALACKPGNWSATDGLRDRLEQGILAHVSDCAVNGAGSPRLPNTTNIVFRGISGEAMVIALDLRGYAVSSGSACSSGAVEPSHVLLAMGLSRDDARSSLRFSLGPGTTEAEVDGLIEGVCASVAHLRRLAPSARRSTETPETVLSHA